MYVIVIVIVNLYSASSEEALQRHSRPNKIKPWSKRIVFRCRPIFAWHACICDCEGLFI